jgi:hypothetical protein
MTRLVAMSCSLGLQSAVGVGDSGNHLFWPRIPTIIYSGTNAKVVCCAQTSMFFGTYMGKLVAEDITGHMSCDTDNNAVVHLQKAHQVLECHDEYVFTHRPQTHKLTAKISSLSHTPENYVHTTHIPNCCMLL